MVSAHACRFCWPVLWMIAALSAVLPAWADEIAPRQVVVEAFMLDVDARKLPAKIQQLVGQKGTTSAESACLTPEQHEQVLKAVTEAGGQLLASPTVLLRDGTEAEVKSLSMQRYLDSLQPQQQRGAKGQIMYLPQVKDAESGTSLKVKADIANEGKHVTLTLSCRLLQMLGLSTFTFQSQEQGSKDQLCIQQPRNQENSVDTVVSVPDFQTLVLGGGTIGEEQKPHGLLILVRPRIVKADARPTSRSHGPAAIRIQTRLVSISRNFVDDIGLTNPAAGGSPFLDDAQAKKLFQAMQAIPYGSIVTTPSVIIADGQEAMVQSTDSKSYVSTLAIAKDRSGKPSYEPQVETIEDGVSLRLKASSVPGQHTVSVSAALDVNRLTAIAPFTFMEKPDKLTVQQPRWSVLSANVTADLPDKHWAVVSSWQVEGTVERETGSGIPVIGRLLGLTNRSVARDTSYFLLLIRPEMLDHMPQEGDAPLN